MKITNGLPSTLSSLSRVLAGGRNAISLKGYPTGRDRPGFASTLARELADSAYARFFSVTAESVPANTKEEFRFSVISEVGRDHSLGVAADMVGSFAKMLSFLPTLEATKENPFAVSLTKGVFAFDIGNPRSLSLRLRAAFDSVEGTGVFNFILKAQSHKLPPLTVENYHAGRLGILEQPISALTSGLGGRANWLLTGIDRNKVIVMPIVGWTTDLNLTARVIKDYVEKKLTADPSSSLDTRGLCRFVEEGLRPLILNEPLLRQEVELVKLD